MTLRIDPLGLCLLRELAEAWEAYQTPAAFMTYHNYTYNRDGWFEASSVYITRRIVYEALLADFLDHLTYIPCEAIDVSYYAALWAHMQTLPEDERNMRRLFDIAQDIGEKAIGLFKEMER